MSAVTLNLSEQEAAVLTDLATKRDLSKTALLRQALRLYQMVDTRLAQGQHMAFVDAQGQVIKQEIIGCGH